MFVLRFFSVSLSVDQLPAWSEGNTVGSGKVGYATVVLLNHRTTSLYVVVKCSRGQGVPES